MISADTNILVRAFLEDDIEQSKEAKAFLETSANASKLFISSYAMLEFAWVLKVKNIPRRDIYNAIITLVDSFGVTIGQKDIVLSAAERYIKGQADFGDYMILAEGEARCCHKIKTFNKILANETYES